MSGRNDVSAMCARNLSCLPRSTISCQSCPVVSRPSATLCCGLGFSPDFMNDMYFLGEWWCLHFVTAKETDSATTFSTWSCRQRYWPSPRAFGQLLRMCSRVPLPEQREQDGTSALIQSWRFAGLGRVSFKARIRNFMRWGSACQMSVQVNFHSIALSHLIQAPCCLMPAILLYLISPKAALTSS